MKMTLNLTDLVESGVLTVAEAERVRMLAAHDTSALGINILVGFGVAAVAGGTGGCCRRRRRRLGWALSSPSLALL